jgi:hypothetical protein
MSVIACTCWAGDPVMGSAPAVVVPAVPRAEVPRVDVPKAEFRASLKLDGVLDAPAPAAAAVLVAPDAAWVGSSSWCRIATIWSIRPTTASILIVFGIGLWRGHFEPPPPGS